MSFPKIRNQRADVASSADVAPLFAQFWYIKCVSLQTHSHRAFAESDLKVTSGWSSLMPAFTYFKEVCWTFIHTCIISYKLGISGFFVSMRKADFLFSFILKKTIENPKKMTWNNANLLKLAKLPVTVLNITWSFFFLIFYVEICSNYDP